MPNDAINLCCWVAALRGLHKTLADETGTLADDTGSVEVGSEVDDVEVT